MTAKERRIRMGAGIAVPILLSWMIAFALKIHYATIWGPIAAFSFTGFLIAGAFVGRGLLRRVRGIRRRLTWEPLVFWAACNGIAVNQTSAVLGVRYQRIGIVVSLVLALLALAAKSQDTVGADAGGAPSGRA
ncbi:MAG TPA: hypothetical protein VIQ54_19280 [Polyangia bacterium]